MPNLVQYLTSELIKQVAVVDDGRLWNINLVKSAYELVQKAVKEKKKIIDLIEELVGV
jgi:hypothetical protein